MLSALLYFLKAKEMTSVSIKTNAVKFWPFKTKNRGEKQIKLRKINEINSRMTKHFECFDI